MVQWTYFLAVPVLARSAKSHPTHKIKTQNVILIYWVDLRRNHWNIQSNWLFTLNLMTLILIIGSTTRTQVKCVGLCFRRQLITINSIRWRAEQTESCLVPKMLISPVVPCFGIVISVRVSPSIRFLTAPFAPMIAP